MSEHLCLHGCLRDRGQRQVNPYPRLCRGAEMRAPPSESASQSTRAQASVCLSASRGCKWDRVGMMTDGNVIHPLIIDMPHLYSA